MDKPKDGYDAQGYLTGAMPKPGDTVEIVVLDGLPMKKGSKVFATHAADPANNG